MMIGSALVLLFAALPVVDAPTSQPAGIGTLRDEARQAIEQRLRGLPDIGQRPLREIFDVELSDGRLLVGTDLADTNGSVRVHVPGLAGITVVAVTRKADPGAAPVDPPPLRAIQLQHYDLDDPTAYVVESSFAALPGMVNISASWQGLAGSRTVQIIERVPMYLEPDNPEPAQISVYVQQFSGIEQETESAQLRLSAPDLPTLVRRHPAEVRQYVRPALAELGLAALVSVDPRVAWQIFADRIVPDADVAAKVAAIVPLLDAPDFRRRQAAAEELEALGTPGALALLRLDRSVLSVEQRSAIDRVTAAYRTLTPQQVTACRRDMAFMLDVLLLEDPDLRRAALEQLGQLLGQSVAFDLDAAPADREARVAALRQELLPPPATQNLTP